MIEFLKLPKISFDEKTHTYSLDGGEKLGKESISRISKIADGDNFGVASGWAAREVSAEILNLFKADTSYTKEEIELMAKDAKSAPRKSVIPLRWQEVDSTFMLNNIVAGLSTKRAKLNTQFL